MKMCGVCKKEIKCDEKKRIVLEGTKNSSLICEDCLEMLKSCGAIK